MEFTKATIWLLLKGIKILSRLRSLVLLYCTLLYFPQTHCIDALGYKRFNDIFIWCISWLSWRHEVSNHLVNPTTQQDCTLFFGIDEFVAAYVVTLK